MLFGLHVYSVKTFHAAQIFSEKKNFIFYQIDLFGEKSRNKREHAVTTEYEALYRVDFTLIVVNISGIVSPTELPLREHRSLYSIV